MEENKNELPMRWWKFWQYFRFPAGIIISVYNLMTDIALLKDIQINTFGIILLVINIALLIFLCVTYYYFIKRKEKGFELLIANTAVQVIYNAFINAFNNHYTDSNSITYVVMMAVIVSAIMGLVWIYPNYIYFKKRKHLFKNEEKIEVRESVEEKNNSKEEVQEEDKTTNNESKEIENKKETIAEKNIDNTSSKNKKFCTKCGKQIEENWAFCNYCGNKLK